jgi:polyisoprenyl-phosphate glycosyltransferase
MLLSIVIPVFNEDDVLPSLLAVLLPVLSSIDYDYELVFVDDGSQDGTRQQLLAMAESNSRIKVLEFSRNFGHQAAITAGLDFAAGDAVVVMDADLQDPPELLHEMLHAFEQGFEVVSAQRITREGEGVFKRTTAALFYALMQKAVDKRLKPQVGDFRLFSRGAVQALRRFREQHRFMRGIVAWLGLKEAIIPFHRAPRAAGTSKYPFWKMATFAWTAISSFSALPLKLSLYGGLITFTCGCFCSLAVAYETLVRRSPDQGWSSLVCLQLCFNGVILIAIGLVGDYVAKIYEETKGRPLYVIAEATNFGPRIEFPERVGWLQVENGEFTKVPTETFSRQNGIPAEAVTGRIR